MKAGDSYDPGFTLDILINEKPFVYEFSQQWFGEDELDRPIAQYRLEEVMMAEVATSFDDTGHSQLVTRVGMSMDYLWLYTSNKVDVFVDIQNGFSENGSLDLYGDFVGFKL